MLPSDVPVPSNVWDDVRRGARDRLEQARKALEARGVPSVTAELSEVMGAVRAIVDAADAHRADLVVMGTRGRSGLAHVLLGSVAERTLRAAPCSMLCVKAPDGRAEAASSR